MNKYPCMNYGTCHHYTDRPARLCTDCRKAAAELDRRTRRPTDEDVMDTLERKPKSWRDIWYPRSK